jgi:hypothetical protein
VPEANAGVLSPKDVGKIVTPCNSYTPDLTEFKNNDSIFSETMILHNAIKLKEDEIEIS